MSYAIGDRVYKALHRAVYGSYLASIVAWVVGRVGLPWLLEDDDGDGHGQCFR